ncbi:unnamed protein product [Bursaphelenchus xylophilus]|uniref:(pine wood nematode) hypothetical protein n=1 Tax=Bursaphelenchus xylophilus TaxID=6326 RepID=A0A7I8XJZ5_BURXY|nr:unnamed protein product [Bursaphelenchus xylophilus]CAG9121317.1 unnamed protein product [Bursaphelenchus xylophilus]
MLRPDRVAEFKGNLILPFYVHPDPPGIVQRPRRVQRMKVERAQKDIFTLDVIVQCSVSFYVHPDPPGMCMKKVGGAGSDRSVPVYFKVHPNPDWSRQTSKEKTDTLKANGEDRWSGVKWRRNGCDLLLFINVEIENWMEIRM